MNKALVGAIRKGIEAKAAGEPRSANPYEDIRKVSGSLTWSRAFIRAWDDGWEGRLSETDRQALAQLRGRRGTARTAPREP
jgi:hypothetical protein